MTVPVRSPELSRPVVPFARDCPPFAPPGYLSARTWAWRSGTCSALNHHFEVMVEAPLQLQPLVRALTDPLRAHHHVRSISRYQIVRRRHDAVPLALYENDTRLFLSRTPAPLLRYLTWHINRNAIGKGCADHVVLHAAAATRAGITVLLPGDQEHGKTTTVAGMLRAGYDYVTDEAVALVPHTTGITPFPKALSVDEGSWHLFPGAIPAGIPQDAHQWQVPAEHFGGRSLHRPLAPPQVIVFPRFVAGAPTRLLPKTRSEAVRSLVQLTFEFDQHPARNLRTLAAVVRSATVADLRIGSLDDAVSAIGWMVSERLLEGMFS